MSDEKVKVFRNPNRGNNTSSVVGHSYIPQYKTLGITPEVHASTEVPVGTKVATPTQFRDEDNPRKRKVGMQQPYATINEKVAPKLSPGELPNIGNSTEQWFLVDNFDEPEPDQDYEMIDNNDYVNVPDSMPVQQTNTVINEIPSSNESKDYLLIYNNKIVLIDSMEAIQDLASKMVFGEHPLCNGNPISVNDILVLKKIKLKIGLFLE